MSYPNNQRKVRVKMPRVLSINSVTVADVIAESLRKTWGPIKHASKQLARLIDANEHTAANLLDGRNAPSSPMLIKLMAEDDEVYRAVLSLCGREMPPSDAQQRAIAEALRILEGASAR